MDKSVPARSGLKEKIKDGNIRRAVPSCTVGPPDLYIYVSEISSLEFCVCVYIVSLCIETNRD